MMTCESRNDSNIGKYTFQLLTEIKKNIRNIKQTSKTENSLFFVQPDIP